tara:strand:+ start:268 stop:1296 length:1029 start_codon:yes stop_codon:yes gene_type:complete
VKRTKQPSSPLLVPSGSSLLDLACSDSIKGAFPLGKVVNIIGDSSAGKTMLALSMFAEMNDRIGFDNYKFIYDDVERALEFDVQNLFGEVSRRIEPPALDDDEKLYSDTIQDFFVNLKSWLNEGDPFIYVLDSFDALTSEQEEEKVDKFVKAHLKGEKSAGSYGMDKARMSSQILRMVKGLVADTDSLVVIISQTRDNIDPFSFEKKKRSGGRALKFYSSHEIWLANKAKLKKKDRVIGNQVQAKVSKNKLTGKVRVVEFPVYYDYGVDSIGSAIDFLSKERWKAKTKNKINAPEFEFEGSRQKLIDYIEINDSETELFGILEDEWQEIEESLKLNRKRKYD